MQLKLIAAEKTDVGRQRDQNEDNVFQRVETLEDGDRGLFIVADGMGGYKAGEVASKLTIETMRDVFRRFFLSIHDQDTVKLEVPDTTAADYDPDATIQLSARKINEQPDPMATNKLTETDPIKLMEEQLKNAIQSANDAILNYGKKQTAARGLGSTVTAALVRDGHACIANVGDSRTYLLRGNELKPVTTDHSLVARLVESKQIDPEDVYTHPQRNLIYRSLGAGHKNVEVDTFHVTLQQNDLLLLCSDGLWEMVHNDELLSILTEQSTPQQKCDKLIDAANKNGGEDNITAVVVQVSAN